MTVRVSVGARIHVGFQNLSLARDRLYGGIGAALSAPGVTVTATPAASVDAPESISDYARRVCSLLDVSGATLDVESSIPAHVGLGSGTQTALATTAAIATAHGKAADVRALAPELGRGGRSGVGVATFESGGFVVDAGHPTPAFTPERPATGEWTVPPVMARQDLPGDWRFLLVTPEVVPGRSGDEEDATMRSVVERADPATADAVTEELVCRLLPAVTIGDREQFGAAAERIDRLNGSWYADEQGGLYREPVATVVEHLRRSKAIDGVGQSSWGPTAYGITGADVVDEAREAGRTALETADLVGSVRVVEPRNEGARIEHLG